MGNEFVINKRTMTITPLRSRTEAIGKIPTPRTAKQCKSFCGVVNYLSLFCPDLQTLLKEGQTFCMGSRAREGIQRGQVKVNQPTCAAPA